MFLRASFGNERVAFLYESDDAMTTSEDAPLGLYRAVSPRNDHISDLMRAHDLSASLQMAIQLVFFNDVLPENMTVYMASSEATHGYLWAGGWRKTPSQDLAVAVMRRAADVLYDMRHHYMFDINDILHYRNNLYLDVNETPPSLVRRLETIETIASCSPLVAKHHAIPASESSAPA